MAPKYSSCAAWHTGACAARSPTTTAPPLATRNATKPNGMVSIGQISQRIARQCVCSALRVRPSSDGSEAVASEGAPRCRASRYPPLLLLLPSCCSFRSTLAPRKKVTHTALVCRNSTAAAPAAAAAPNRSLRHSRWQSSSSRLEPTSV